MMRVGPHLGWAAGTALSLLAACEPPEDVEPLACVNEEPGVVDIGRGDLATGFLPLDDGDDLHILFGPQGMHMVVVSARVENLEAPQAGTEGIEVQVSLLQDGTVVGGTINQLDAVEVEGVTEFLGLRAVITNAEVDALYDTEAQVDIVVRDGCGRALEADQMLWLRK